MAERRAATSSQPATNVSALRKRTEISQPALSQHLAVLRSAERVREERQGSFVNYEVDPDDELTDARFDRMARAAANGNSPLMLAA